MRLHRRRLIDNQHSILQIVKNASASLPDNRHQPFPAGKAFSIVGIDGAIAKRPRITLVTPALARGLGPGPEVLTANYHFTHGNDLYFAQLAGGKLRLRIEAADRVNLIAEEFDARRSILPRRPDIDNAAPHRELANSPYRIFAYITRREQFVDQLFPRLSIVFGTHDSTSTYTFGCTQPANDSTR